jgi:hypothetical protein
VALLTLIALSALALYTDLALSKGLQIVDHLIRAAIGLGIAALILMRWKHLD